MTTNLNVLHVHAHGRQAWARDCDTAPFDGNPHGFNRDTAFRKKKKGRWRKEESLAGSLAGHDDINGTDSESRRRGFARWDLRTT